MATDYLPARDGDLALWTANFAALTTATPTAYGMSSAQALNYATNQSIWQNTLAASSDPSTRTPPAVQAKNDAKAVVKSLSRAYARVVQAYPSITPEQIADLGLTVRAVVPTPVPTPTTYPIVGIQGSNGTQLVLFIADQSSPLLKRKPNGIIAAEVFYKSGVDAPVGLTGTTFLGLHTKSPQIFPMDAALIGTKIWIIARWVTRTNKVGPLSAAVSAILSN